MTFPPTLPAFVASLLAGPERDVLYERDGDGVWHGLSNRRLLARARAVAAALRASGCAPGDRVALKSPNRIDWVVADLGILFAGGVSVPIYATQALDQVCYILEHAAARRLFVDSRTEAERLRDAGVDGPIVVFDAPASASDSFAAFEARGAGEAVGTLRESPPAAPDELAVLVYTSGTTGMPKGVMLSHRNVIANAVAAGGAIIDGDLTGEPVLSILPFAHIYEHTNLFAYLSVGVRVFINRAIDGLIDDLRSVRPVLVVAVPRVFERCHAAIVARATASGGVRAWLVPWALRAGLAYKRAIVAGVRPGLALDVRYALAYMLVLSKLRAQLGCDRLRSFISGSAPLHADIALTFAAADIPIVEGYGLTECAPVVTVNRPRRPRFGTVGPPLPGVEVRIASDGEVLVRGPNVMLGYYRDPAGTAAVMHSGWLATGDIGSLDEHGCLRIIGRKNELFKTSGGKIVAPARIETALARSRFIASAVAIGNGRTHPAALLAPDWSAVCSHLGIDSGAGTDALANDPAVRHFLLAEVQRATADLAAHEQIRWAGILPRALTIDGGEVTPTLKLRRDVIEQRFGHLVPEFTAPLISS